MPDLIAQGPRPEDRWRREIPDLHRSPITLGREQSDWNVPWDPMVSRRHVRLLPTADHRVEVRSEPQARNPVFHRGEKASHFTLVPGDHFVIGKTTFTLVLRPGLLAEDPSSESVSRDDVTEHAYDHQLIRQRRFRDAASRIDILNRLPDLIQGSLSDQELFVRVANVLLSATPAASVVAVVKWTAEDRSVQVLHYDQRVTGRDGPPVSSRLVRRSVKLRESVLHLWSEHRDASAAFTASEDVDWAFCVPIRSEACPGWALYLGGQLTPDPQGGLSQSLLTAPEDLEDDVKFAELVGSTMAGLRHNRRLQRRQAAIGPFFAPIVLDALSRLETDEVLAPREETLAVMFCDLRGFTSTSQQHANRLMDLLARVSDALGVMTRRILETDGVIGDFHGDAAMGFWGWPLPQDDIATRAARAAWQIRCDYRRDLSQDAFACGIGVATGDAVAGRIGTTDQVKVTAFGPVVNLASRLEGMTKLFGAEVIIDEATAEALRDRMPDEGFRVRRLARCRVAGWDQPLEVHQLIGPPLEGDPTMTDDEIKAYEDGLAAMIDGDWEAAYRRLYELPPWDRPKDRLLSILLRHNRQPPKNWEGVIE